MIFYQNKKNNKQIRMCNHHNVVLNEYGTSTCVDCCVHFDKSLLDESTSNCHYDNSLVKSRIKSSVIDVLEKEFGINDYNAVKIAEKIFNLTSKNKMLKGTNKRSILCASLYYAYHYLEKPKDIKDLFIQFELNYKTGSKGLKACQIAIQECSNFEIEINKVKNRIHCFTQTHKEKLQKLIERYNIPLKNYEEIEKLIILSHFKKNKVLSNKINTLWLSCIFFWLIKINPCIDPEDFISLNSENKTSPGQLKIDLTYLKQICNSKF